MAKGSETLASVAYTRNEDGQVAKATSKGLPGAEVTEDTYDENNRLTKYGGTEYKYDAANNATKEGSSEDTYNEGDELEKGGGVTYSYNEVGERTKAEPSSGPATTYGYDQAGNLTSVERPEGESKPKIEDIYAYNGDGLRASQTISGTTSYVTWDTAEQLPLLLNDGTNSYIYGPGGLPVEQISSGGTVTYLHHDQQGSTRLLTNASGESVGTTTYDAYRNVIGKTGTVTTRLGYDAQYTDGDTGLIYLRAREYDPATVQFLSVDPKAEVTRAIYSYAQDDPLADSDPTGEYETNATEIEFARAFEKEIGHWEAKVAPRESEHECIITQEVLLYGFDLGLQELSVDTGLRGPRERIAAEQKSILEKLIFTQLAKLDELDNISSAKAAVKAIFKVSKEISSAKSFLQKLVGIAKKI